MNRPRARSFDHALRYWVASRTVPGKEYLVQFDSYGFNGECQCKDFAINFEPLLRQNVGPESALAGGLVELRDYQQPRDALRCFHICDGLVTLAEDFARAVAAAERKTKP
jgi:hypothetical protein